MSLDLIYGTPGESLDDWRTSVEAALALAPDHLSAYALIVEEGTALARQVARGEIAMTDDDDLADKYELADERVRGGGLRVVRGVELGALRGRAVPAQHRLLGRRRLVGVGPGAHSHVGGVRWWNVKHPAPYAERIAVRGRARLPRARCSTPRRGGSSGSSSSPVSSPVSRSMSSTPRAATPWRVSSTITSSSCQHLIGLEPDHVLTSPGRGSGWC